MALSSEEIERRKPLWFALADLWLDTDVPAYWAVRIVRAMHAGGFTLEETHNIFRHEISPAFCFNGFSAAGEWEGWGDEFVTKRVLLHLSASPIKRIPCLLGTWIYRDLIWKHNLPFIERALQIDSEELMKIEKLPG